MFMGVEHFPVFSLFEVLGLSLAFRDVGGVRVDGGVVGCWAFWVFEFPVVFQLIAVLAVCVVEADIFC